MPFWVEVHAIFWGDIFASVVLALVYFTFQWFLRVTDVTVSYNWSWQGTQFHPNFQIRNRSWSKEYRLANIAYTRNGRKEVVWFDNKSIWDQVLPANSIRFVNDTAAVPKIASLAECTSLEITVRLQTGRLFWLTRQGPGQLRMGGIQRAAFWLRDKIEKSAVPIE